MMRVLEVIRQGQIGGGETHLLDLVDCLDKDKVTPVCLSFTDGEMVNRLRRMGIDCHVIETAKPFDLKVQHAILQLISKEHVQLIHAHGSRAASNVLWAAKRAHLPLVYTVHGWSFHADQPYIVRLLRALSEKMICRLSNDVICVSKSNAETGRRTFGLRHAHVIENGINLQRFDPAGPFTDLRHAMHFGREDVVVGFIARCTKQKNPIGFLNALDMAHQRDARIKGLFVGEGDMDGEVDAYIRQRQMGSFLYRSAFRTDVPELLSAIDIYCLPSLWEGLSIALLEAMAMEKAIIATPTDGTGELICHDENGVVVPFEDVDALAQAINRLAASPQLREKYGQAARRLVETRFNAQRVANKVTEIYESHALP